MTGPAAKIYLARHGQTDWSLAGKHTGRSDIALNPHGEEEARKLGARLRGFAIETVLTSPLQRAKRTCEIAGFGEHAQVDPDLMEWNYGKYEGLLSAEIHARTPEWHIFRDGCPGGEQPVDVSERADRIIAKLKTLAGDVLIFSHGHFLRVLSVRWAGLAFESGARFALASASLCILSTDAHSGHPVIERWNDTCHLER